jgi:Prokaryotic E2 family D
VIGQALEVSRRAPLDDGYDAEAGLLWISGGGQMMFVERAPDGRREYKMVEAADVAQAFSWSQMDTGWLPPELVRWGRCGSGFFGVLHIPAARWPLRLGRLYEGRAADEIVTVQAPLPECVLLACGSHVKVFAVPDGLSPQAKLYYAPVPNLYQDGGVCYGANSVAPLKDPFDMPKLWQLFLASPFNADMAGGRCQSQRSDVRRLLLSLDGVAEFPKDELLPVAMPYRASETLGEALDNLAGLGREQAGSLTISERNLVSPDPDVRAAALAERIAEEEMAEQGEQERGEA